MNEHYDENYEEESEEILPFSSPNTLDYFDEIERMFTEQKAKKGKPPNQWRETINVLIDEVNKRTKMKMYDKQ